MKLSATIISIVAALAFVGSAIASMPGQESKFAGGAMGEVTFSGQIHANAGLSCGDCHTGIFNMAREAKITMADHAAGNFCFSCHKDGGKAFAHTNCARCHKK